MNHRLLTSAAANLIRGSAATTDPVVAPAPAPAPAPVAQTEQEVQVVTLTDAQAAVETARGEGAAAERARTSAVLNSDAGKAHPATAEFLLNTSPTASAEQIIGHMASMPAATAAPAKEEVKAITTPLTETPPINVAPNANAGNADDAETADAIWGKAQANADAARPMINASLPRTGN